MISLIIFFVGVIVTFACSLIFISSMDWWLICVVAVVAIIGMIAINGFIAIVFCKWLPKKWFAKDSKFFNATKKECAFYDKLKIKKWKDKTLDLGKLNGFKKNKVENNSEYIERFILENNMGFVTHFASAILGSFAFLILPINFWLPMGVPIVITSLILNVIPVMILRYNMPRLRTMMRFNQRKIVQEKQSDSEEKK